MTGEQLRAWRRGLGLSRRRAAATLGLSESQLVDYESGRKRGTDRAAVIPRHVELACLAITAGLA